MHHDFKPGNVFVSTDGRVRVLDLALTFVFATGDAPAPDGAHDDLDGDGAPNSGEYMLGNPAYLAPEMLIHQRIDARSDQYSFCVALYEALYRRMPHAGSDLIHRLDAMQRGRVEAPPRGSRVPPKILGVLRRGLSCEPDARWRDMMELVEALERATPRSGRVPRRWSFGIFAVSMMLVPKLVTNLCGVSPAGPAPARGAETLPMGNFERILAVIAALPQDTERHDVWLPTSLFYRGGTISGDSASGIVLTKMRELGLYPVSSTRAAGGRTIHFSDTRP